METKAVGRPTVNAAQMWRYFTTSVYTSGDLPVVATREALQNSVDAIRAAVRDRQIGAKEGRFDVVWDAASRTLSWSDNGLGMDASTILDKFLSLGDSGKAGASDSSQAAGGFGIAKAVILGTSDNFRWEMDTRDNRAVSSGTSEEVQIFESPFRQGTAIRIFDVPVKFDERYSYARSRKEPLLERLRLILAANDLPEIRLSLNGQVVAPLFNRRGGSRLGEGGHWGTGTTAGIRAYRRPPGDRGGAFYVRLGGLIQFDRSSPAKLPADVVVDLLTTVRPGENGYPLNAARDQLQGEAGYAFQDLTSLVERENESAGDSQDYDVYLPDGSADDGGINEATREALTDPQLRVAMAEAAGGLVDYYQALARQPHSVEPPTSTAPVGSRIDGAPTRTLSTELASLTSEALAGRNDLQAAVDVTMELLSQAGNMDSSIAAALNRAASGAISEPDQLVVADAVRQAASQAITAAMEPGSAGLLQASVTEARMAPLAALVPQHAQRSNPFGGLAGLRVSKKNFDRARAYQFRKSFGRWLPYLIAWDSALRLVAAEGRISRRFAPGFILDDRVTGMAALEEGGPAQRPRAVVYIHPFTFRSIVQAHHKRPMSIAYWLHGLACHELTHLDGKMGEGHSESFVSAREDLGFATSHLLPPLSELVSKVLLSRDKAAPPTPTVRLASMGLAELEAQLLSTPPDGVDREYLASVLRRLRPSLLASLMKLLS